MFRRRADNAGARPNSPNWVAAVSGWPRLRCLPVGSDDGSRHRAILYLFVFAKIGRNGLSGEGERERRGFFDRLPKRRWCPIRHSFLVLRTMRYLQAV